MVLPTLTEQYLPLKRLGVGAMGDVFCVENLAAKRYEAMKVLKKIDDPNMREVAQARFKREVRAGHRLSHPNIVPTFDCGELPDGRLYLTMEFVDGPSLAQVLHQRGTLPVPLAAGILAEIADAVHHAHRAGVIHRDIKPQNVLLPFTQQGPMVKMLDLGLAKILFGDFKESMVLSKEGVPFGTPMYMSPEQCQGKRPDPRSDIYAIGCLGYELLTGHPPFTGNIAMIFTGQLKKAPTPMSVVAPELRIPRQLDQIVLQCLQKSPEMRFQNGGALCSALQTVPGYKPLRAIH
ncbi:MAG TPA: serine/threonine-protein kinase [Kofleriaceae bacterium]|nr:serine/threonine-protein kinase [Kofleriaceae bacterium]